MQSEDWELFSSSATVYGSPNKPDRVYLEGSPASFIVNRVEQVPQGPVAATAAVVEYRRDENKLTLSGDARLELGDEVIRSKYIEYDIENNRYQAGGVDRVSIEVIPTK
jgi:lipopolysaccharide transport protein LptA